MSLTLHMDQAELFRLLTDLGQVGNFTTGMSMTRDQKSVRYRGRYKYVDTYSFDVTLNDEQIEQLRAIEVVDSLRKRYEK